MLDLYLEYENPFFSLSVFGTDLKIYRFGLYVAVGILAAVIAMLLLSRENRAKKGTGIMLAVFSIAFGAIASRLCFCLMDQFRDAIPVGDWLCVTKGGWSLFGVIAGAMLAAWLTAKVTKQDDMPLLDAVSCALPLFVAAERAGEYLFEGFDVSRSLTYDWLINSFLAVKGEYEYYLRTYYVAAAAALVLFLLLNICRSARKWAPGKAWTAFMILFGAGGIVMESLRYDYFLSISFVHLQQILYAAMMLFGIVAAIIRSRSVRKKVYGVFAIITWVIMAVMVIWVEFAIDRSEISHILLYGIMVFFLTIPSVFGFLLIKSNERKEDR